MDENTLKKKVTNHIKNDPHGAAVFSKLIANPNKKNIDIGNLNFYNISHQVNSFVRNNEDILDLFPDTQMVSRILRSSILSPNDMISDKLTFTSPDIRLPSSIKMILTDMIKDYIYANYEFVHNLDNIIEEALITKGAYVQAIIPESSVDDIIHQRVKDSVFSNENGLVDIAEKAYNELNNIEISTESFISINNSTHRDKVTQEDLLVNITDNFSILNVRNIAIESYDNINFDKFFKDDNRIDMSTESNLDNLFINPNTYQYNPIQEIPNSVEAKRVSLSKPLVIKLPVDSIIPIHVIGDPSKHIGYFVILDETGNPLDYKSLEYTNDAMMQSYLQYESNTGVNRFSLVDKAKAHLNQQVGKDAILNNLSELYNSIIGSMIEKRLKMGNIWKLGEIDNVADIYRVMLTRALKQQRTNLLYLPKELVNYFAYEYRDNGTGKSLMEKNSILYSIRAILLFTKIMAQTKNSITNTKVTVNLDEDDPDPQKTIDDVCNLVMQSRKTAFPFGVVNVKDLSQWAQSLGFYFDFKGNGITNMEVNFEDTSTNKVIPDSSIDEDINKMITMGFGVPYELVNSAVQPEFATTVVSNNILFAKYILQLQKKTNKCLKDLVRKILLNDGILQAKFKNTIIENISEIKKHMKAELRLNDDDIEKRLTINSVANYILKKFVTELEVTLPEPDVSEADSLNKALDVYKQNLENYLNSILDSNTLTDKYLGKFSGEIEGVKGIIKSVLIKKWAEENNYLPEVSEILTKDINDKPFIDINDELSGFINSLAEFIVPMFKTIKKEKNTLDKRMDKYFDLEGDDSSFDSGGSDMSDTSDDNSSSGDTGDLGDSLEQDSSGGMDFDENEFDEPDQDNENNTDTGSDDNSDNNQDTNNQNTDENTNQN